MSYEKMFQYQRSSGWICVWELGHSECSGISRGFLGLSLRDLRRGSVGHSRKVIGHDREHDDGFRLIVRFFLFDLILSC